MSIEITALNLDDVVKINKTIQEDIQRKVLQVRTNINTIQVSSSPQLAIYILKEHGLIQIPIENPFLGGAIFVRNDIRIPFLNTALPRANQYFTAWHEVYHLYFDEVIKDHIIETDNVLEERKADYFSSQMLLGNLMPYFNDLPEMDFADKVFCCMNVFQAPYKSVLISLYESACVNGNDTVKELVKKYFDAKFPDIVSRFKKLGLDDTLVMPSNVVNVSELSERIKIAKNEHPELSYHEFNEQFLENIMTQINLILGDADV